MSLENVKNIVLILSGKGGVGKSSVTTQLALSLSLAGKSVGILDIDLTGPSIPRFLGTEDAKIKQAPGGWLPVEVHKAQVLPPLPTYVSEPPSTGGEHSASRPDASETGISKQDDSFIPAANTVANDRPRDPKGSSFSSTLNPDHNSHPPRPPTHPPPHPEPSPHIGALHAISLAFLLPTRSSAVIWRGPKKTAMVRQFLTDVLWPASGIDYLLIDTPPGTSDEHIALAETLQSSTTSVPNPTNTNNIEPQETSQQQQKQPHLAGAIIVTTPQAVAVSDVRKELNFCRKTSIAVLGVIENMAGFVCECCGERTDVFGKGGGELMAREFGVRFLGGVSLDVAWGRLVEEGRRPRYGGVVEGREEGDGEGDGEGDTAQHDVVGTKAGKGEGGLLVEKYRSCKLSETFEGITRQLVQIVEGEAR